MTEPKRTTSSWTYSEPTLLEASDSAAINEATDVLITAWTEAGYDMTEYTKEIQDDIASIVDEESGTEVLVIRAYPADPSYSSDPTDSPFGPLSTISANCKSCSDAVDGVEESGRIVAVGVMGPYDSNDRSECKALILDWLGVDSSHTGNNLALRMISTAKQHVHDQGLHFCLETYSKPAELQPVLERLYSHKSLGLIHVPTHKSKKGFVTYYSLCATAQDNSYSFENYKSFVEIEMICRPA